VAEYQSGAGVPHRATLGSLWQAMSGRPLSADVLDWPPDLFALTSAVLQRSGAHRFALSPPRGRQWPPGSRSGWSATVEAAGRAWSGVVDAPAEPVPPLLVSMMEVVVAAATTPLEELSTGADWDLCAALLTLHAVADEACAGLGAALTSSNPLGCGYRGRARELLAQRGTFARISPDAVLVLPKVRTPAAPGTSIRSMSRYVTVFGPSVGVRWHKLPARRRGTEPRADHVNFLLLPWPLRIRASDFRPIEGSAQRDADEPYGFFDFDPAERLDLDLVDQMLVAARGEVDNVDVVCLPESAITEDELAPLEALLESHGVASLTTGVRRRRSRLDEFPDNWAYWGLSPQLEKGRSQPLEGFGTGWLHVRQGKHHRWSLDAGQIYQYHLGGELHPEMRWWEAVNVPQRFLHFIEFGQGFTVVILICEDLAQNDEVADLIRAVGPTGIVTPLLDGPQLTSRWSARYASVFADDPGSAVLTLSAWGLVDRCRPRGHDAARVVGLWKDPRNGFNEIPLESGAQGILLTACTGPSQRHSNDGRRPAQNAVDLYAVGLHQIRAAATGSQDAVPVRQLSDPPPLNVDELTVLCGWAEAVAEALAYAPSRVAAVLSDAAAGSPWRATLGLSEPSDPLRKAIQFMDDVVSNTAAAVDPLDAMLAAVSDDDASGEGALTSLVRRVLLAALELRESRRRHEEVQRAT
jgi:hypothetical protein